MLEQFNKWSWPWDGKDRPRRQPRTRQGKNDDLNAAMEQSKLFKELLEATGFYADIGSR